MSPPTTSSYHIRPINPSCNSAFSNTASATTNSSTTTGVPAAPSNLTASAVSAGQIQLDWQDNSDNESRFEIFRSSSSTSSFSFLAQVGAGVTSFINTGLASGATFFYRVRAVNSAGNSGWTTIASTTASAPPRA